MKTIKIRTQFSAVKIAGSYLTETGLNGQTIEQAEYYTADEVEDIQDEWRLNMPNETVTAEPVIENMPFDDFLEAVCSIYNNHKNTWNWNHNGQYGRYARMAEVFDLDRLHSIQPEDVTIFAKSIQEMKQTPTIQEVAEYLADQVGQHVLANPYDDVTFEIIVKA